MKTLPQVTATAEQLPLISQNRFGVEIICGAAGSGKTSTAILRLRSLCHMFAARRARRGDENLIRVLVLTFNRTLAGYIRTLAQSQIATDLPVELEIDTFGRWAMRNLGYPEVADARSNAELKRLARGLGVLTPDYIVKEVEYLLGRFEPEDIDRYITAERTGRGPLPRVDRNLRRRILTEVVVPYQAWLKNENLLDWNSIAVKMTREVDCLSYDVVIVDESQDFSANQLRAVRRHLAADHAITFVIDTVQRIYARGFTWAEAGIEVRPERVHVLSENHRNTVEIATFAAGILNGIGVEGDGALPNLEGARTRGLLPTILIGKYAAQAMWALDYIENNVDLDSDSVAFLKPQGGNWFSQIKTMLIGRGIRFVDITREPDWPAGAENVALSTFHSAKGLEFDYVFILGFNDQNTPYDMEELEDAVFVLRRLLAVAVARARKAIFLGYKPGEESRLTGFFAPNSFVQIDV